jgi:hypothetical protein
MPRVKNSVATRQRRKKVLDLAKGARGGRSKLFKSAKETVRRGLRYAFRDRRVKKREFERAITSLDDAIVKAPKGGTSLPVPTPRTAPRAAPSGTYGRTGAACPWRW